ncbi:SRPBCC domain-containing protein [Solirubrobacter sp. CPCC 204708]|uniref:SRPBCC domain-containing protein n=1 Tax=Solirubrobacter deserti TaxID=2282478 RepID=A0ABT4RS47_9ACTN|nr:SRPBCC domain-containing protein [Solirubrobacter deserti]MBE2318727.1 SRPBCC domain-containing protein [Solirubrobacter deserti]MDA0141317.1 SRPBCC domain-containing protein [Solirubrobacter deserti]
MSMDKPFRVEVTVDAPRDAVWRALTEPEQVRHWFGWEYDGLEAEIKLIFEDHATLRPPDRIEMPEDGLIELVEAGEDRTLIRVTKPGDLDALEWKDVYGDIEEGWITFLNQLRHRLAFAPDGARRTITRSGKARMVELPGTEWHASRYQRGFADGAELAVLGVKPSGDGMLIVTLYDPSEEQYAAAETRADALWAQAST